MTEPHPSSEVPRPLTFRDVVFIGSLLGLTGLSLLDLLLPVYGARLQEHYGMSLEQFGLVVSGTMVPSAVAALAAGIGAQRFGPARVLAGGFALGALGMGLAAWAPVWPVMLAAAVVIGSSRAALVIALQSYLVARFPRRRRRMITVTLVALSVLSALVPLLAEGLKALERAVEGVPFAVVLHVPFALGVLPMLAGAILMARHGEVATEEGAEARRSPMTLRAMLSVPAACVPVIALATLHVACDTAQNAWLPRVLESRAFDAPAVPPGVVAAMVSVAYVVSRALFSLVPDERARGVSLVAPGLLGGAVALTAVATGNQVLASSGIVLGAFLWSVEYPAVLGELAHMSPNRFAMAQALVMLLGSLTAFGLATMTGWLGGLLGEERLAFVYMGVLAGYPLFSVGAALWIRRGGLDTAVTARRGEPSPG